MNSIKKVKDVSIVVVNNERIGIEAAKVDFGKYEYLSIE